MVKYPLSSSVSGGNGPEESTAEQRAAVFFLV